VVGGGCTWSKVKTCFLGPVAAAVGAAGAPAPAKALEGDSMEMEVLELACMTERWKRAGMDVESWLVGGRIRRAVTSVSTISYKITTLVRTNLYRGRRCGRRARGGHGCSSHPAQLPSPSQIRVSATAGFVFHTHIPVQVYI